MKPFRIEKDPLGELRVPSGAYYGVQTQRAVENFPISGVTAPPELVTATVQIKKAAAEANRVLGRLDPDVASAIGAAADEVLAGGLRDQFVVDVYQAGAGTSHNMNVNEVLANRAAEILGAPRGEYERVHPNDHVNMGQSTNDVFPTATRLALLAMLPDLLAAARELAEGLAAKAAEFETVLKTGRTHLQDAVPMTLGQEFGGFAANVAHAAKEVERSAKQLLELNLGSTAVGTGLNAGNDYTTHAIRNLASYTGAAVRPAVNRFRVTQSMGDVLGYSGALRRLAAEVGKIASDLRLLSMGPRAGIAEIRLPAVQPGSSIMPGKVNPSVPEMVNQVCFQVFGCDATILIAAEAGQLELNVMMPVIAWNAIHATRILGNAMQVLQRRCVAQIEADETGRSIRELVRERGLLSDEKLDRVLSAEAMTLPGVPGSDEEQAPHGKTDRARSSDTRRRRNPQRRAAAAQPAVPAGQARHARRTGSGRVAAPRSGNGHAAHRGRKRRR
jgi:aspartate ammonia-lyase